MSSFARMFWMILLACMWSPSFLFVKLAVVDIPPLTVTASRVTVATLLFGLFLLATKRTLPTTLVFWRHAAVMGVISSSLPFALFCYVGTQIDTALAAVINGSSPIFTLILALLFCPGSERLSFQKVLGIFISVAGLFVLFLPSMHGESEASYLGMLAALTGAFSYAVSHIYGKKNLTHYPPFVVPATQLAFSSLYLWPLALTFERPHLLFSASPSAYVGIAGLGVMGSFCAFLIYYKLLRESGPTSVSAVACIFPVIAMFLGFIFLNESLTFYACMATIMIFGGLFLVNELLPSRKKSRAIT